MCAGPDLAVGEYVFHSDGGAVYDVVVREGVLIARGRKVGLTYTSARSFIRTTGMRRYHTGIGNGKRAVFSFDTGEGVEDIRGVLVG